MTGHVPKISVGLPVYNGEQFVGEAIASILGQTCTDFELIVSDNASTDGTEDVCRAAAAADPRVRYERQPENRGASWNFNRVFQLARGKYFKWAAHDDLSAPQLLARCVEVLEADPAAVICYPQTLAVIPTGEPLEEGDASRWGASDVQDVTEGDRPGRTGASRPHWRYQGVLLHVSVCHEVFGLIRSEALRRTGLIRSYYGSDKVLLAELALLGPFRQVPEPLFLWRHHLAQSMALPRARDQQRWIAGKSAWYHLLPQKCPTTLGHLKVIWKADVSWPQRLCCLGTWLRYVLQLRKWKRILAHTWQGLGSQGTYQVHSKPDPGSEQAPAADAASARAASVPPPHGRAETLRPGANMN